TLALLKLATCLLISRLLRFKNLFSMRPCKNSCSILAKLRYDAVLAPQSLAKKRFKQTDVYVGFVFSGAMGKLSQRKSDTLALLKLAIELTY
ncbi:hypothetical protein, partial [Halobacteriovorax sp. YZS-3-2]|uniref:hypothetical protein n=1 Tax=Halobacteriovorax sp. YZS-3-2 TaxID=3391180 RepID=UPI00399B9440